MNYLTDDEVSYYITNSMGEELFGILKEDGESTDGLTIEDAVDRQEQDGGAIYKYK